MMSLEGFLEIKSAQTMETEVAFDQEWKEYISATNKWVAQQDFRELVLFIKEIKRKANNVT